MLGEQSWGELCDWLHNLFVQCWLSMHNTQYTSAGGGWHDPNLNRISAILAYIHISVQPAVCQRWLAFNLPSCKRHSSNAAQWKTLWGKLKEINTEIRLLEFCLSYVPLSSLEFGKVTLEDYSSVWAMVIPASAFWNSLLKKQGITQQKSFCRI